jgi:hypothetical protein
MDLSPEDKKVADLVSKLKYSSGAYPKDMLYSRRQQFIRQVASAGLGIGVGAGIKNAAKQSNTVGAATATITSKILESVLIAAIVIEAGTAAYVYREKITNFFKSLTGSPNVEETTQKPDNGSDSTSPLLIPTLTVPATSGTPSAIAPAITSSPNVAGNDNNTTTNVNATPVPTDNNGNQFGLTPKPERTKDTNPNNNDVNGNGNNDNNSNNGNSNK